MAHPAAKGEEAGKIISKYEELHAGLAMYEEMVVQLAGRNKVLQSWQLLTRTMIFAI